MAVEHDPAWEEYSKCYDRLQIAVERMRSLPDNHPDKNAARAEVILARSALNAAGNKIEPKYRA
ncbi:hypothetical protein [Bradyrhizobium liaoningense]|uniref:hypothetical protein n=1 Tax=Bradyrhizobium liaoningense TaxID=43992 RepID=UPI001BA67BB0|nr:hypothetical protein [Bradyrhizobium liaoningense]MBR0855506.1 hypothetical protein [Bradyrhizobium liaoningense]